MQVYNYQVLRLLLDILFLSVTLSKLYLSGKNIVYRYFLMIQQMLPSSQST